MSMKRYIVAYLLLIFSVFFIFPKIVEAEGYNEAHIDQDSLIVKYKDSKDSDVIYLGSFTTEVNRQVAKEKRIYELIEILEQDPKVEFAQPNYIYKNTWEDLPSGGTVPDGFDLDRHWYYEKAGLPELWENQLCPLGENCGGSEETVVAVIDSGLAFEDFDDRNGLSGAKFEALPQYEDINLFVNEDEIPDNGKDDDCNGYVDDVHGADTYTKFILGDETCSNSTLPLNVSSDFKKGGHPVDTYGHGTFTTGLISSFVNSTDSVSPAFNVSIMPIAANIHFDEFFTTKTIADALDYAIQNEADVINLSLTTSFRDAMIEKKIDEAIDAGIIVVAAAGNESSNAPSYPASFDGVISLGAVNDDLTLSSYSNFGENIDFVAYVGDGTGGSKGAVSQYTVSCFSSCSASNISNGGREFRLIGTSFAAPQFAALAALLKSDNPNMTDQDILNEVIKNIRDVGPDGYDETYGYGIINYDYDPDALTSSGFQAVKRFWNNDLGTHFYTQDRQEQRVLNNFPEFGWIDEGFSFNGGIYSNGECSDGEPVYYFKKLRKESYFYTIEEEVKEFVEETWPDIWRYEGVSFCAYTRPSFGLRPVHRYWSESLDTHFFTIKQEEREAIDQMFSNVWDYERIEFYAYPFIENNL